jgi:O-antigen/teichoic acid export membrane protein
MNIENPRTPGGQIAPSGSAPACSIEAEEDNRHQEHFKTDHLLTNLKGHTISSGAVTISSQGAKFLLSLVSTMILARLLTPRDFGLVAMVITVTSFLRVFKDAGLSIATVQRERITHAQVSNLFWINIAVSALCTLIVAASAPVIAWFYHDPQLIGITLLLSVTFLISGSTVQHQALLKRQMRFKALALIEVGSMAVGVLVGVLMALLGYRYWSLVGSSLTLESMGLLLTWSVSRWRPQLPTRNSGIGPLVSFGAHRTAGDFILSLARGSDNLLIGRFYGAAAVGLYSRASALLIRPLEQFLSPINAVFIPTLSRLQSQPERYRSTFLRLYEAIALIGFLFTGLFLALAWPLTLVLLGPKWGHAAVIFGGFTVAALCVPLANVSAWLFTSQGRGRDMFVAQLINSVAIIVSFIAGLPFGPVGVAVAFSASNLLVRVPIYYYLVGRRGPVRTADLWRVFFRHLPVWVVVFFVTWLMLILVVNLAPLTQLLICAPIGATAGAAFIYSFRPQRQVAIHLLDTLRELKSKPMKQKHDYAKRG